MYTKSTHIVDFCRINYLIDCIRKFKRCIESTALKVEKLKAIAQRLNHSTSAWGHSGPEGLSRQNNIKVTASSTAAVAAAAAAAAQTHTQTHSHSVSVWHTSPSLHSRCVAGAAFLGPDSPLDFSETARTLGSSPSRPWWWPLPGRVKVEDEVEAGGRESSVKNWESDRVDVFYSFFPPLCFSCLNAKKNLPSLNLVTSKFIEKPQLRHFPLDGINRTGKGGGLCGLSYPTFFLCQHRREAVEGPYGSGLIFTSVTRRI